MTTPAPGPAYSPTIVDLTELPAAQPVTITSGGPAVLVSLACLLLGWTIRETSGSAAASGYLTDGPDANGQHVAEFGAGAGLSTSSPVPPPGVLCKDGLAVHVVSGAFTGAAWIIPMAPGA